MVGVWSETLHLTAPCPTDAAGLQSMLGVGKDLSSNSLLDIFIQIGVSWCQVC